MINKHPKILPYTFSNRGIENHGVYQNLKLTFPGLSWSIYRLALWEKYYIQHNLLLDTDHFTAYKDLLLCQDIEKCIKYTAYFLKNFKFKPGRIY